MKELLNKIIEMVSNRFCLPVTCSVDYEERFISVFVWGADAGDKYDIEDFIFDIEDELSIRDYSVLAFVRTMEQTMECNPDIMPQVYASLYGKMIDRQLGNELVIFGKTLSTFCKSVQIPRQSPFLPSLKTLSTLCEAVQKYVKVVRNTVLTVNKTAHTKEQNLYCRNIELYFNRKDFQEEGKLVNIAPAPIVNLENEADYTSAA